MKAHAACVRAREQPSIACSLYVRGEKALSPSKGRGHSPSFPLNLKRDLSPLITLLIARGYCKAQWHSWGEGRLLVHPVFHLSFPLSLSFSFALRSCVYVLHARTKRARTCVSF